MQQYLHDRTSQTATEPRKGILNTNNTIMTNDMTWRSTWFQLQQQTAATSAKTWLIRWIPCPCFDPYPTTFGLPILGHLEHGRVYFITAPLLKGTRTLLVCNEAVTAHQQQHRHIDNNISIITLNTPLHIPPQKNKLLLQLTNNNFQTNEKSTPHPRQSPQPKYQPNQDIDITQCSTMTRRSAFQVNSDRFKSLSRQPGHTKITRWNIIHQYHIDHHPKSTSNFLYHQQGHSSCSNTTIKNQQTSYGGPSLCSFNVSTTIKTLQAGFNKHRP